MPYFSCHPILPQYGNVENRDHQAISDNYNRFMGLSQHLPRLKRWLSPDHQYQGQQGQFHKHPAYHSSVIFKKPNTIMMNHRAEAEQKLKIQG